MFHFSAGGRTIKTRKKEEAPTQNLTEVQTQELTIFINKLTERKYNTCHDVYNESIQWNEEEQKRWNLFQAGIRTNGYSEQPRGGHTGRHVDQSKLYHEISKLSFINTVCETGFWAGHSAFLWLNSNLNVKLYSFDLGPRNSMDAVIKSIFGDRFHMTKGDSRKTLPKFHESHPSLTCDLAAPPVIVTIVFPHPCCQ